MQVPWFSSRISLIEMAPCPAPALFVTTDRPAAQGTGSDWKILPITAQFLSTQTDTTMFALIYKVMWQPNMAKSSEMNQNRPFSRKSDLCLVFPPLGSSRWLFWCLLNPEWKSFKVHFVLNRSYSQCSSSCFSFLCFPCFVLFYIFLSLCSPLFLVSLVSPALLYFFALISIMAECSLWCWSCDPLLGAYEFSGNVW